jgi:hypothetical protein
MLCYKIVTRKRNGANLSQEVKQLLEKMGLEARENCGSGVIFTDVDGLEYLNQNAKVIVVLGEDTASARISNSMNLRRIKGLLGVTLLNPTSSEAALSQARTILSLAA